MVIVRWLQRKSEKGAVKWRRLDRRVRGGRSLRGWKAQESKSLRPGLNILGAKKEDGFQGGRKPLKRRCEAGMVSRGIARAERGRETFPRSPWRREALKGKAQERWGLKKALKDMKVERALRGGSQTQGSGT